MKWSRLTGFLAAPCLAVACASQVTNPFSTGGSGGGFGGSFGSGGSGQGGAGGAGGAHASSSTSHHASAGVTSGVTTGSGAAGSGQGGAGTGGAPATCIHQADCKALNDACNVGSCVNNVCVQMTMNDGAPCDDGLFCTDADTCLQGVCAGVPKDCPASDACHVGTCSEAMKACTQADGNDGASCVLANNVCFIGGNCANGNCVGTTPVDCSALTDACNTGVCDKVNGCQKKPANPGGACDDGLFCTVNDTCKGGVCGGTPNLCGGAPNDPCLTAVCDEATKTCTATPGNNGVACTNPNTCLTGATCSNGTCLGGVAGNNGKVCNDGNACDVGPTCAGGVCGNPASVISMCINGDGCCPPGCTGANDSDCLYWQPGVLSNVAPAVLSGWTNCYTDTYNVDMSTTIATVVNQCSKGKLLMACRPVGAPTFTIAAMGLRADVLFDCGSSNTCTHQANGVGWYYSATWSWGFVSGADPVARNECDTDLAPNSNLRLCWHTVPAGGYRCGATTGLNGDMTWERDVFQAD